MPSRRALAELAVRIALVACSSAIGIAGGELLSRWIDGFVLASLRLKPTASRPVRQDARADTTQEHVDHIEVAPGMQREWFNLSPTRPTYPHATPAIYEAALRYGENGVASEAAHVFNWFYVQDRLCGTANFPRLPGFVFAYDAPHGSRHPAYRYPRNAVLLGGMATNAFGWRGPPLTLRKPPGTLRIAFVGASTTVNRSEDPFSYPELVGFWLDRWVRTFSPGLAVEIINAGREGIASSDIAAIVRQEVVPLAPDLVVYYEGSNQFKPQRLADFSTGFYLRRALIRVLENFHDYSALSRRLAAAVRRIPFGRDYRLAWPAGIDEKAPALDNPELPLDLPTIIADLEAIRVQMAAAGGELAISSFFWLFLGQNELDPLRDENFRTYLVENFYPLGKTDLERLAAFQNRVFATFAAQRGTPFIDVAAHIPRDPSLYIDPIHATYPGVRLHAWIAAQLLAPILKARIDAGQLPRAANEQPNEHPAVTDNERTVTLRCERTFPWQDYRLNARVFAPSLAIPPRP